MNELIRSIENEQIREDLVKFSVGDTIKVHVRIKEGNRERIQVFEGTVIKKQNGGLRETFTVRRVAYGTGVERTFPMNAPIIEKIEVVRLGKVRRAKLYYLRDRVGKAAKTKELAGARIENKEIIIKGEEVKAEVVETENVETAEATEVQTAEATVENKAE